MTRFLFLLLVASLPSHAQAVRPAPAPAAPMYRQPDIATYPAHTPTGTGLPTPGQPGAPGAALPRSPNKRILPASAEPGLWAADGAPRAIIRILDVDLVVTQPNRMNVEGPTAEICANLMAPNLRNPSGWAR